MPPRGSRSSLHRTALGKRIVGSEAEIGLKSSSTPGSPKKLLPEDDHESRSKSNKSQNDDGEWSDSSLTPPPPVQEEKKKEEDGSAGGGRAGKVKQVEPKIKPERKISNKRMDENGEGMERPNASTSERKSKGKKSRGTPDPVVDDGSAGVTSNSHKHSQKLHASKPKLSIDDSGAPARPKKPEVDNETAQSESIKLVLKTKNKRMSTNIESSVFEEAPKKSKLGKANKMGKVYSSDKEDVGVEKNKSKGKPKEGQISRPPPRKKPSRRVVLDDDDEPTTPEKSLSSSKRNPLKSKETSPTKIKLPSSSPAHIPSSPDKLPIKTPPVSQNSNKASLPSKASVLSIAEPSNAASAKGKTQTLTRLEDIISNTPGKKGSHSDSLQTKTPHNKNSVSVKHTLGTTTGTPVSSIHKIQAAAPKSGLLAQTLGTLAQQASAKGKDDKKKDQEKERSRNENGRMWGWEGDWALSTSEQREFNESRQQREVERKKRNAYAKNPINLQESEDAFKADKAEPDVFKSLKRAKQVTTTGLPSEMLHSLLNF
ncbi:uncharacterized protein L203_101487 [Cryptococcus depauperatus CBS 7841]|uniref:Uncharacterized protein n=1 Tax=Cryptococcus depauperatus CBS 7841 TaxID=1295531 RepID=A0AAJ8JQ27_9TREE